MTYRRNEARIRAEASLDGIYVLRTSEPRDRISAEDAVRAKRSLCMLAYYVQWHLRRA